MQTKFISISVLFILFLLLSHSISQCSSSQGAEEFHEGLLLKPLPDRKVLSHFHFHSFAPSLRNSRHHNLFPKSISQLAEKFHVKEFELSFTQGRWNYENWGGNDAVSNDNAKPPGVELWAIFNTPEEDVDSSWKNFTNSLSGLFCASINFLESSTLYASPKLWDPAGQLRYGSLPREAVCTENLTPWLKLLPCRDKQGFSELLHRSFIYNTFYHSQRLRFTSDSSSLLLNQTLTLVLPSAPTWSLSSLFGTKLHSKCPLSGSSIAYIQLPNDTHFELIAKPENSLKGNGPYSILYEYDVGKHDSLDLGVRSNNPLIWNSEQTPLRVSRFLTGSGNERGAIAFFFRSVGFAGCVSTVEILQIVPWYVKVYYHTLRLFVNGRLTKIQNISVTPSVDKVSPSVMEAVLHLPCDVESASLSLDFDKGFLHIDEYPPDANQGFDIPSAIVRFTDFRANFEVPDSHESPILSSLQKRSRVMQYTEVLLVPLTTPDFSMPYNVITITCTVFALYFGSLLNILRKRDSEEKSMALTKQPLLISTFLSKITRGRWKGDRSSRSNSFVSLTLVVKVILVAAFAVVWKLYLQ